MTSADPTDRTAPADRTALTTTAGPTAPAASSEAFAAAFGDWTPRAVVFDCDGMLLDTESVWQRAQDTVVARHGAQLRDEDETVTIAPSGMSSAASLALSTLGLAID